MEIIQERLEREYDMTILTTVPQVSYEAYLTNGEQITINNPAEENSPNGKVENPAVLAEVLVRKAPSQLILSKHLIKINRPILRDFKFK